MTYRNYVYICRRGGSQSLRACGLFGRLRPQGLLSAAAAIVLAATLTGCKPTENNYKAAYDAALAKREHADADRQALADGHQVLSLYGPQKRTIDGRDVYVETRAVRPEGEGAPSTRPRYMVGVAVFRMGANAKALAERLRGEGYEAFLGRDSDDRLWVVIPGGSDIREAAGICDAFRSRHPDMPWTGLPGTPVVID